MHMFLHSLTIHILHQRGVILLIPDITLLQHLLHNLLMILTCIRTIRILHILNMLPSIMCLPLHHLEATSTNRITLLPLLHHTDHIMSIKLSILLHNKYLQRMLLLQLNLLTIMLRRPPRHPHKPRLQLQPRHL